MPTISFSFTQDKYGLFVFNETSINVTTYKWDFEDASVDYSLSPTHHYKEMATIMYVSPQREKVEVQPPSEASTF